MDASHAVLQLDCYNVTPTTYIYRRTAMTDFATDFPRKKKGAEAPFLFVPGIAQEVCLS
jgi:hypothetical protein